MSDLPVPAPLRTGSVLIGVQQRLDATGPIVKNFRGSTGGNRVDAYRDDYQRRPQRP